ncbi:MAG: hypothetical protein Q8N31_12900 [Reyranella sp.]|nr:hypothetical protein [Reyranella sp.]
MKLRFLLIGVAAATMAAGSASAQLGQAASPDDAATPPNTSTPAPADSSATGIPSVDSTKLAPGDQGRTNLPGGEVNADTSARADGTMGDQTASSSTNRMASDGLAAPAAGAFGTSASVTTSTVTNGPVPDTAENRRKYGQPMSRAGKRTSARGN